MSQTAREERIELAEAVIRGVEQGVWNPTDATKRALADLMNEYLSLAAAPVPLPEPRAVLSLIQYIADGNLVDTGVMMEAKRLLERLAAPVSLPQPGKHVTAIFGEQYQRIAALEALLHEWSLLHYEPAPESLQLATRAALESAARAPAVLPVAPATKLAEALREFGEYVQKVHGEKPMSGAECSTCDAITKADAALREYDAVSGQETT